MGLESGGGLVSEGGVFAVGVVVGFDVGEDLDVGIGVGDESAVLEHLGLEGAHEGLGPGVVIGIGTRGHALAHPGRAQEISVSAAAVLAATVAVEDQAGERMAGSQGLLERSDDQVSAQMVGQGPADDLARTEINDDREIKPSGGGGCKSLSVKCSAFAQPNSPAGAAERRRA